MKSVEDSTKNVKKLQLRGTIRRKYRFSDMRVYTKKLDGFGKYSLWHRSTFSRCNEADSVSSACARYCERRSNTSKTQYLSCYRVTWNEKTITNTVEWNKKLKMMKHRNDSPFLSSELNNRNWRWFFLCSGKRYNSAQKFKIALRVLFESATNAAYKEENPP